MKLDSHEVMPSQLDEIMGKGGRGLNLEFNGDVRALHANPAAWKSQALPIHISAAENLATGGIWFPSQDAINLRDLHYVVPIPPAALEVIMSVLGHASEDPEYLSRKAKFRLGLLANPDLDDLARKNRPAEEDRLEARKILEERVLVRIEAYEKSPVRDIRDVYTAREERLSNVIPWYTRFVGVDEASRLPVARLVQDAIQHRDYDLATTVIKSAVRAEDTPNAGQNALYADFRQPLMALQGIRRDDIVLFGTGKIRAETAVMELNMVADVFAAMYQKLGNQTHPNLEEEIRLVMLKIVKPGAYGDPTSNLEGKNYFFKESVRRVAFQYLAGLLRGYEASGRRSRRSTLEFVPEQLRQEMEPVLRRDTASASTFMSRPHWQETVKVACEDIYRILYGKTMPDLSEDIKNAEKQRRDRLAREMAPQRQA